MDPSHLLILDGSVEHLVSTEGVGSKYGTEVPIVCVLLVFLDDCFAGIIKPSVVLDDVLPKVCSSLGFEFILEDGGTDRGGGIDSSTNKIPEKGSNILLIFLKLLFTAGNLNLEWGR